MGNAYSNYHKTHIYTHTREMVETEYLWRKVQRQLLLCLFISCSDIVTSIGLDEYSTHRWFHY